MIYRSIMLASLLAVPALAQGNSEYDLAGAVREALKSHPSLRGASARVAEAQAGLRQSRAGYAPQVDAVVGYTRLDAKPSFTVPSMGTLVFGEQDNGQASLVARLPLFTGGRIEGATAQARSGVEAAQSGAGRQEQKVALDTVTAFYGVGKARGLLRVAEDQRKSVEAQRDAVRRMVDQGVATRIDLLRAETAVAAANEEQIRAANGEKVARAVLSTAMGMPADANLAVRDSAPVPASALPADAAPAVAEALGQRPELLALDAERRGAQAGVKVARSGLLPNVGLFAQYDATRPTTYPDTGRWAAGVALTLNVFDAGATRSAVDRARSQVQQLEATKEELRNAISLEVTQAVLTLRSARQRLTVAEAALVTAEEGVRLVRLGYQNQVNTMTDFLAAQSELTRARTNRVLAQDDLHVAEAVLRFALGRPARSFAGE